MFFLLLSPMTARAGFTTRPNMCVICMEAGTQTHPMQDTKIGGGDRVNLALVASLASLASLAASNKKTINDIIKPSRTT